MSRLIYTIGSHLDIWLRSNLTSDHWIASKDIITKIDPLLFLHGRGLRRARELLIYKRRCNLFVNELIFTKNRHRAYFSPHNSLRSQTKPKLAHKDICQVYFSCMRKSSKVESKENRSNKSYSSSTMHDFLKTFLISPSFLNPVTSQINWYMAWNWVESPTTNINLYILSLD